MKLPLATLAKNIPIGHISVMFDLDKEGENGAKQTVLELAKHCCVRLAWDTKTTEEKFKGRQQESITVQDSEIIIFEKTPTLKVDF